MKSSDSIKLTVTPEAAKALEVARRRYPELSDEEILTIGLSNIAESKEKRELRAATFRAFGEDYWSDPAEDIYHLGMGRKVHHD